MSKKKKLTKIANILSTEIIESKALLESLSDTEQSCYPANVLLEILKKKNIKIFKTIEKTRKILKITD